MPNKDHQKSIKAPFVHTKGRVPLRVLGTDVTIVNVIREHAKKDLGIDIQFEVLDGVSTQQQAVTRQDSFDVYDQWFHSVEPALDVRRHTVH